ncbi:MAG: hypothetical protein ABS48_00480 [Erythrobacter sp. SCN 68-10]|nr:MAG: hypothetical protein ABS48_00480 [Erythrobacter sp. SCN 68-10]
MKRTAPRLLGAGALAALLAVATAAAPLAEATAQTPRIDYAAERAAIGRFQDFDQRLQDVGWRLVRGNAAFCPRVIPAIGLQLQDMASYGRPDIARTALGLAGDFAVQTAARGSPAEETGAFARNREIVRLGQFDPNQWPAGKRMDWERVARAHDHVDALLTEHGGIAIGFADGGAQEVRPVSVCATRFELMGEGGTAVADGGRVVIGIDGPAFDYEEAMFAALVAHELAHNLLGHSAWLDRNGRGWRNVRRTEREADRLIPWLLANAGYDPAAAARFMGEWGPRYTARFLPAPTHDGWPKRLRAIEGELPLIAALREAEGHADWSRHFRREIEPLPPS